MPPVAIKKGAKSAQRIVFHYGVIMTYVCAPVKCNNLARVLCMVCAATQSRDPLLFYACRVGRGI